MNNSEKLKVLQKRRFLQKNIVTHISNCLKSISEEERLGSMKIKLTAAIKSAVKKVEKSNLIVKALHFESDLNQNIVNHTFVLISNPKIEKLRKDKSAITQELWLKENELRSLHRRYAISKDLTRNEAIKGMVFNIIKKFNTLSKEKQNEFITDKKKLSKAVETYVEKLIDSYEEANYWGINFDEKQTLLNDLSTGKDVVALAANLSSKHVHLATMTAHNVTRVQLEICERERDELKLRLEEVNKQLTIEYAKDRDDNGISSSFGGGSDGGGGVGISWD